ncbi:hypothetical protein [Nocardia sp. NPDC052112]|uniref:hypothetical protein n=1 Tax=Nocardia sp. NPDC052112 TaxID=3155646 RepID=UPI00341AA137
MEDMKPKAVGLVRPDKSGSAAPRHAIAVRRHAEHLGYRYLYTVQPPEHCPDPIGCALYIASGVPAAALISYDLATTDNTPARVCDFCTLETVCPPTTWAAALPGAINPAHAHPGRPLTVDDSYRIMQQHIACRAIACPRKASALDCLVRAGKLVPPIRTPRERAAARGLPFPALDCNAPLTVGPDIQTLLDVLDGLTAVDADVHALAAQLANNRRR